MVDPICVDWQITSECSRNCSYCYGPSKMKGELSSQNAKRVVDNLQKIGTKMISLTGGEPLARNDVDQIMQYIVNQGFTLGLVTNCDFYQLHQKAIFSCVKFLSIPIEGSNPLIHDSLRGKGNYSAAISALSNSYQESDINLLIGTVLTKNNVADLINIEKLICPYEKRIRFWKIYEMIDYNGDIDIKQKVERNFFEESIFPKLGSHFPKEKIIFDSLEKRSRSYFLIRPDGEAFMPILDLKPSISLMGNVLDEPEKVMACWNMLVDAAQYRKPYRCLLRKDL